MKASIRGIAYYYAWLGAYDETKPTVLCLHGFTGKGETFAHCLPVAKKQANFLMVDLIGHGQSAIFVHPYRYQMASLCEDLALLLAQLNLKKVTILGYSMGARVGLAFGISYPEMVSCLLLESGSPGLKTAGERKQRRKKDERLAQSLLNESLDVFVAYWENLPLFATQKNLPPRVQQAIQQERKSQQRYGLACSLWFMGTGAQMSYWAQLKNTQMPIYLLVGSADHKFVDLASAMTHENSRIQAIVISDAGHCVHMEKPDQFSRVVEDCLLNK